MCLNYHVKTTTIECKSLGNASYSDKQLAGNIMTTDCYQHTTRPVKQLLELSNYNKQCKNHEPSSVYYKTNQAVYRLVV